jgi:myo-inositol 2-dehydrogenase/D-chiro-inositol 1-dehydrogenase
MLRLGVLGCGRIGKVHARAAIKNPKCKVTAVADAETKAAAALAEETGARAVTVDETIAARDVDAVIICSPTDTHVDYVEAAAKAGKAIL